MGRCNYCSEIVTFWWTDSKDLKGEVSFESESSVQKWLKKLIHSTHSKWPSVKIVRGKGAKEQRTRAMIERWVLYFGEMEFFSNLKLHTDLNFACFQSPKAKHFNPVTVKYLQNSSELFITFSSSRNCKACFCHARTKEDQVLCHWAPQALRVQIYYHYEKDHLPSSLSPSIINSLGMCHTERNLRGHRKGNQSFP